MFKVVNKFIILHVLNEVYLSSHLIILSFFIFPGYYFFFFVIYLSITIFFNFLSNSQILILY